MLLPVYTVAAILKQVPLGIEHRTLNLRTEGKVAWKTKNKNEFSFLHNFA